MWKLLLSLSLQNKATKIEGCPGTGHDRRAQMLSCLRVHGSFCCSPTSRPEGGMQSAELLRADQTAAFYPIPGIRASPLQMLRNL